MKKITKIIPILLVTLLLSPLATSAAILTLETGSDKYGPGDSFAVDVNLDLDTGCINTADIEIAFDKDYLLLDNFLSGDSILSIWVNLPKSGDLDAVNQSGIVNFSGGIPGGYCGKVPGDPAGRSNLLGRLIFRVPKLVVGDLSNAKIGFTENTRVMLNDGLGTIDSLKTNDLDLELSLNTSIKDESWQEQIKTDIIPPEPFVVEIHRNENMFEGRYYIIFSTRDKQSGIDRYEIMETGLDQIPGIEEKKWYEGFFEEDEKEAVSEWVTADMPYPLGDQRLQSIIKVKAVDKAGNERLVEYFPPEEIRNQAKERMAYQKDNSVLLLILGVVGFLLLLVITFIYIFVKRRRYENKEQNISAEE